jgi:hypothetical protein
MSIGFEILSEGNVVQSPVGTPTSVVTAGPRCVVGRDGGVICTYMAQSGLGINDFVPMIARSDQRVRSWSAPRPLWPELAKTYSIFCNLSRGPAAGELFCFGSRTVIDAPGESFWNEQTHGLKQNDLVWSRSRDDGQTWSSPPRAFPLPYPGTAEVPGALLATRNGRWIGVYSPYNSFDPALRVERQRVVAVYSDDQGQTWQSSIAITFDEPESGGAEAWVTELTDGRLLAATWQVDLSGKSIKYPNRYAISRDGGTTWGPTRSTGIIANTVALTPLDENRAIFTTVRRGADDAGIWLSLVQPTDDDFGVLADQRVWSSSRTTQSGSQAAHDNWTDFTYGEPCVTVLPDGTLFMVFWYLDQQSAGIRYLHLRMTV